MARRVEWILPLILSALVGGLAGPVAGAGLALDLSPPMVDLTVEPGGETSFTVVLGNKSETQPISLKVRLSAIAQQRNGSYQLQENANDQQWSAVSWLQLRQDGLVLSPRGEAQVEVKVKVPRGASGSRAAAVVFEVVPEGGKAKQTSFIGGTTTFTHRLTTIVKVTVRSRANRRLASLAGVALTSGATDQRFASYGKNALAFVCSVVNEGNVLLAGQGRLLIRNAAGRRVAEVPLGGGRGVVLPGTTVDFVSIFPSGLPEGDYTAEAMIRYGGSRPLQAKMPFHVVGKTAAVGEAQVADTVHLLVDPELVVTQLPAGAFRGFAFTMTNLEKVPLRVRGMAKGLGSDENGELIPVEEGTGQFSAVDWVRLEPDVVTLAPGEKKNLRLSVQVPKDVPEGTRYASLVLEAEREGLGKSATATTISTPVVVSIGKNLVRKAELGNGGIALSDKGETVLIGASLVNQGNTHLKVSGKVILRRREIAPTLSGGIEYLGEARFEDLETISLASSGWVLPGTSWPVVAVYSKPLEPGEYQAEIVVDIGEKLPVRTTVTFMAAPQGTNMEKLPASAKLGERGEPR